MNNDKTTRLLQRLESDGVTKKLIAQNDSRYILFNVQEPIGNFPKYTTSFDEILISTALSYLSIGCTYAENGDIEHSIYPLEKSATILENIHSPLANRTEYSSYFILTSSLAFYAANQYSKSFILLKGIQFETVIAELISKFLRRKYEELDKLLSEIFLSDEYSDQTIAEINNEGIANNKIYVLILSKSLASLLEFVFSGNDEWLGKSKEYLIDLLELIDIDAEPSLWWVVRLLNIIIDGFQENSLWKVIPPHIGDEGEIVYNYITAMAFQKSPVVELFPSQKISLPKVLDEKGAVVSLPTSAGKTRIAELAILDCLVKEPDSKILYLAPFRSLAYEVEASISKVFEPIGFNVSHLYGGTQFSKLDEMVIKESSIIIATPEKAKAILRSNAEFKSDIKLVILDEGHLIGPEERKILSEVFIEELRLHLGRNQGKIILLSAVLPNTAEIADWISGDKEMGVKSNWRPSTQRFGLLEYSGGNVNITWQGEIESFNRNFIKPFVVKKKRSEYTFPENKKGAIAATALKLSSSGSVLIFVCQKRMVLSQAEAVILAMEEDEKEQTWSNLKEWSTFKLVCEEAYGEESRVYQYAKYGILCHHGALPTEVRLSMEKLMRSSNPKVIIATTTLGQGVNIGVSTVIIANVWYGKNMKISSNDFWNIAGRAGRSFIDREGKILFAVDGSRGTWITKRDKELAFEYFNDKNQDEAISGLLHIVDYVYNVAETSGIEFNILLQMIAENDYSSLNQFNTDQLITIFDWIDDTLLALNLEFESHIDEDASAWIDDYFRYSLAYIQVKHFEKINGEEVILFLKARNKGVLKLAGPPSNWHGLVSSSIPIRSGLIIRNEKPLILETVAKYQKSNKSIEDLICFLKDTESIISMFPSKQFVALEISNEVKELWIKGQSISTLDEKSRELCNRYFSFALPWGINAIARMLSTLGMEAEAEEFETLAVLVQMGLPNMFAAKIYLTGIHSRVSATELSNILDQGLQELSVNRLRSEIVSLIDLLANISGSTILWLSTLKSRNINYFTSVVKIPDFTFEENITGNSAILNVKKYKDDTFLCSPAYDVKIKVKVNEQFPFDIYANDLGMCFKLNHNDGWTSDLKNPYLQFK